MIANLIITINSKNYVRQENCNSPVGDFQVEAGINYIDVKKQCERPGVPNANCIFKNVENLTEAINICQENIQFCERFSFNKNLGLMKIVTLTSKGIKDPNYDSYTMQTGITYSGGVPGINANISALYDFERKQTTQSAF